MMNGQMSLFDFGPEKTSQWAVDIDNGMQMLRCESCGCRAIRKWYDRAVGGHGFQFCPYCGARMLNDAKFMVSWPGFKEDPPKKHKWTPIKRGERGYSVSDFRCNVCGEPCRCSSLTDFCSECGTYMREDTVRWPERGET